ncbi:hypothetical protein ACLOJK_024275 [Asimina triloba]
MSSHHQRICATEQYKDLQRLRPTKTSRTHLENSGHAQTSLDGGKCHFEGIQPQLKTKRRSPEATLRGAPPRPETHPVPPKAELPPTTLLRVPKATSPPTTSVKQPAHVAKTPSSRPYDQSLENFPQKEKTGQGPPSYSSPQTDVLSSKNTLFSFLPPIGKAPAPSQQGALKSRTNERRPSRETREGWPPENTSGPATEKAVSPAAYSKTGSGKGSTHRSGTPQMSLSDASRAKKNLDFHPGIRSRGLSMVFTSPFPEKAA